jgi:acylaminoacyl-peptidase
VTSPRRGVERLDLVRIRWPLEPSFSPDGGQVAYVVSGPDKEADRVRYRLCILDRRSNTTTTVSSLDDIRSPRWSPDGRWLACLAGGVPALLDETGKGLSMVASAPRGARAYAWLPDGDHLAVAVAGRPEPRQSTLVEVTEVAALRASVPDELWLVPVGGEAVQIGLEGFTAIQHLACAPNGMAIAFCGRRVGEAAPGSALGLFVHDFESAATTELVAAVGSIRALAWSPDGSRVAYLGHHAGASHVANLELHVIAAKGAEPAQSLSSTLDRSVGQVVRGDDERGAGVADLSWTPSGILTLCAFGGSSVLLRFDADGHCDEVNGGRRAILGFATCAATGEIVFTWSDDQTPGELSICDGDGSNEQLLSAINREWRSQVALAESRDVNVVATDGATVEGWLTIPAVRREPVPLVLQVHGGPHYPVGNRFSFDAQRLAAAGIAVLRANPRGAQGYGIDFASGIQGRWGGRDFADLLTLLDEVVAQPEIDEGRVAIVGESYGGFMVNWALANDDRFVAGIAENGVSFLAGVASGIRGTDFWDEELGGPAWQLPDTLARSSPWFAAASVDAPLLLIHAEADSTVPIAQSEAMFVALKSLGREVRFFRIPQEEHWVNVFGAPSRRLERLRIFDDFLLEHLGVTPPSNGDLS